MPAQLPPLPQHSSQSLTAFENDYGLLVFATEGIHVTPEGDIRSLDPAIAKPIVKQYAATFDTLQSSLNDTSGDVSVLQVLKTATGYAMMTPLQRAIFRSRDMLESVVNGCNDSTASLSADRADDYETLPGDNIPAWKNGMASVVTGFLSKLEDSQVVLEAEVTSIKWDATSENSGEEQVIIGFRDGLKVQARCVVWTPSLNVTKRCIESGVFDPALPKWKTDSLRGRYQGCVEKVFAVLDEPVKDVAMDCAIPVVWEVDEADKDDIDERDSEWEKGVYALSYDNSKQTISFWLTGSSATSFTALDAKERIAQVGFVLTYLLSQTVSIQEVVCSNWGMNEFTRGSYSYGGVGCDRGWATGYARPAPSEESAVLYFAGEASHEKFYSTMHGAIESGYREAERCKRFLDKLGC